MGRRLEGDFELDLILFRGTKGRADRMIDCKDDDRGEEGGGEEFEPTFYGLEEAHEGGGGEARIASILVGVNRRKTATCG